MNKTEFEEVFFERVEMCKNVLTNKSKEYSIDEDKLHNFKVAAELQGCSPQRALGGFLAKHIVSIFDMINSDKDIKQEVWDEKIGDALCYLFLLDAIILENRDLAE